MLTWYRGASGERISAVSGHARAYGTVIDDDTFGTESARCRTRINALLILAGKLSRAFGTGDAFGSASRWATDVISAAGTYSLSIIISAFAIGSTY